MRFNVLYPNQHIPQHDLTGTMSVFKHSDSLFHQENKVERLDRTHSSGEAARTSSSAYLSTNQPELVDTQVRFKCSMLISSTFFIISLVLFDFVSSKEVGASSSGLLRNVARYRVVIRNGVPMFQFNVCQVSHV